MTLLADWCVVAGWPDPMAHLRLTYHDRSSCQRETRFLTDPLLTTTRCFHAAGLRQVANAHDGDIAVVQIGPREHAGAVMTAYGWASRGEAGVTFHDAGVFPVLKIWGVGYAG